MRHCFQDPATHDLTELYRNLRTLHDFVGRIVEPGEPRLRREGDESFGQILAREYLPARSSTPDEVFESLAPYFQGMLRWNHPGTMINVTPPPTYASVAAAAYVSLHNPNGAQDMSSGLLLGTELAVVKMISQLAGFDGEKAGGLFTFGGKSTNLHAVKQGIQRAQPRAHSVGVQGPLRVVSSAQGHPSHQEVCGWLGIGEASCLRVPTRADGTMDLDALDQTLRATVQSRAQIATIFANGGSTIQLVVDPIGEIVALRDAVVRDLGLDYVPRVHVDSVLGWVWLFFREYAADINFLGFPAEVLERVQRQAARLSEIHLADSFGVDFHKTGFASYSSSLYMAADRREILEQGGMTHADHPIGGGGVKGLPHDDLRFGHHAPFQYTLELSRPMTGPVEAYVNLKLLGVEGYQRLVGGLLMASHCFGKELTASGRFEVLGTRDSLGFAVLFAAKPSHETPSVFDHGWDAAGLEAMARYNYEFYRSLFEQQGRGRCPIACDYSSGYHTLVGGARIGVHKSYPMSPFYDQTKAVEYAHRFSDLLMEFDSLRGRAAFEAGPHEARPMIFRPGTLV